MSKKNTQQSPFEVDSMLLRWNTCWGKPPAPNSTQLNAGGGVHYPHLPCQVFSFLQQFQVFSFPTTSRWIPVPRSPFLETWFIQPFSRFCLWSSTSSRAWCCAQLGILQEYPGPIWKDRVKPTPFLTISPDDILKQLSLPFCQLSPFRFDSISKHLLLSVSGSVSQSFIVSDWSYCISELIYFLIMRHLLILRSKSTQHSWKKFKIYFFELLTLNEHRCQIGTSH